MPQIIASTYELIERLASGGGGVVYLARHLRLGKDVVLKADKRTLAAGAETLRREVDALKNLSHTYIPQVYDFFVEQGTVYTVMDHIPGESLDRPLKRGERFPQPQVIRWACQLLEALVYLHSRPPHGILHSDIKPANIMVTPEGEIRLIDFNIALALGEKGAVRVGFSRGYASPEHYGVDYSGVSETQEGQEDPATQVTTAAESPETRLPGETQSQHSHGHSGSAGSSSTGGKRTVLLDVRSDIYSLGATLYHVLTGVRPAQEAKEVLPITDPAVSPAVREIIRKAMDPDPDRRYQTAAEMLDAFTHLHENDPRTKARKRRVRAFAAVCAALFLAGGALTFTGLKQLEQLQAQAALQAQEAEEAERAAKEAEQAAKEAEQAAKLALEAIARSEAAFARGDLPTARAAALEALEQKTPYDAQAQYALTQALGVYDLSDGYQSHRTLTLPGAPLKAALSPSGERAAILTSGEIRVFDLETGEELACLAAHPSALSDLVFLEEQVLLYAAPDGLTAYDLEREQVHWTGDPAVTIALSGDRKIAAAVDLGDHVARIYDTADGTVRSVVSFDGETRAAAENTIFADPQDDIFVLNQDGSRLAVSFADGGLELFDLARGGSGAAAYEQSEFTRFEGGFHGDYFAFAATGPERSVFAVLDVRTMEQTGGFSSTMPFHTQTDESGVYLSLENILVRLDPVTGEQTELAYGEREFLGFRKSGDAVLTVLDGGGFAFYGPGAALLQTFESEVCGLTVLSDGYGLVGSLNSPEVRILKRADHGAAPLLTYDPAYLHSEARLSADGKTFMLFRYDSFRIYTAEGMLVTQVELPDGEQVHDQQFRRDGQDSWLDVIYRSGLIRAYNAADGSLRSETQGPVPDETLYEEFETDQWRITSPLHGTPEVYDKATGQPVAQLEQDAYLTYVTQVGDYVITEYLTGDGQRCGLLLDDQCRTLAKLPRLSDVLPDGRLIFDDGNGALRESEIWTLDALKTMAEEEKQENSQ